MSFTDLSIKALKPTGVPYRRYEAGADKGFGIQVSAKGAKTFFQFYVIEGKRRFMRLGAYPDTSLFEARQLARNARKLTDQNIDPQVVAESKRQEEKINGSVLQLFESYVEKMKTGGKRSFKEVRRCLMNDAYPHIGQMRAKDVRPHHIRNILFRLINRGSEVQSNRLRSYLFTAFKHGIYHDNDPKNVKADVKFMIETNPVESVPKDASVESVGHRALSFDEIASLWQGDHLSLYHLMALRLIIVMGGQRSGEITEARISEFDFDQLVWVIPPERTKNKRYHLIPITPLVHDLIKAVIGFNGNDGDFLFPSRGNPSNNKPINKSTLSQSVIGYCKKTGMEKFTPKDLRRTVKTRMGEIGLKKDIRDRLQNHALTDVSSKHYDRYDYLPEKREALETWCNHINSIIKK